MEESKRYRITNIAAIVLVISAFIADTFTIIPFVGDFVGPIFWVLASLFFWKNGLGLLQGKRGITTVISTIMELIPGVQELPAILVGILIIITTSRIEDKTGISMSSVTSGKPTIKMSVAGRREPPPRIPANQGDVRPPNGGMVK